MIKELTISQKNLDLIQTELEDNRPYEACGVMIGTTNDNVANVEKIIRITNVRRTAASFELDPQQFYNAWNDAEKNGNEIVGIYHTHPFYPAIPSSWDRDTMKSSPSVWIIAGTNGIYGYIYDDKDDKDIIKDVRISVN